MLPQDAVGDQTTSLGIVLRISLVSERLAFRTMLQLSGLEGSPNCPQRNFVACRHAMASRCCRLDKLELEWSRNKGEAGPIGVGVVRALKREDSALSTRRVGKEAFRGGPASEWPLVLFRTRDRRRTNIRGKTHVENGPVANFGWALWTTCLEE